MKPRKKKIIRKRERESVRKRERKERSSLSLRTTEFRLSEFVRPRTEVHLLDESYAWVPKSWDFAKDSS